jgi:LuxR family maltose regulon positive regulatory protein
MSTPILKTKLFIPPLRPGLLSRPRLMQRLDAGLRGELTLIAAPAGFGKTTLLSAWINQSPALRARLSSAKAAGASDPIPNHLHCGLDLALPKPQAQVTQFAWLSLDAGDNDPARFWRYVIAALHNARSSPGIAAEIESFQASLESLLTGLINEFVVRGEQVVTVLALDDYHVIHNAQVHESLNYLLDHLPPQLHVVIASRQAPPLGLPRRRGRGALTELRAADLRFSDEEAALFLGDVAGLTAQDVAALQERAEGWPVGLQMAALSLEGREDKQAFVAAFAGDDRYVSDYLLEEVLQRQPPQVQSFLLQTSILEQLNGPLCDAVCQGTGQNEGQAILNELERANLFIAPLDDQRHSYRYQRLFAGLLRSRLQAQVGVEGLVALHLRASACYQEQGLLDGAISHALKAADWQRAAALIEDHGLSAIFRSEIVLVRDWLRELPPRLLRSRPVLCIIDAWARVFTSGPGPELEQSLQRAQGDEELGDWVQGQTSAIRAVMARQRGDAPQEVRDLALQALARLAEDDLRLRGNLNFNLAWAYFQLGDEKAGLRAWDEAQRLGVLPGGDLFTALVAVYGKSQLARLRGRLPEAAAICQEALATIVEPRERAGERIPVAGSLYIGLGNILLEWNELEKAERLLDKGLELIAWTGETSRLGGLAALARLRQAQGDHAGARAALGTLQTWLPDQASYAAACTWFAWAGDDPRVVWGEWDPYLENVVMARARIERYREQAPRSRADLARLIAALREWSQYALEGQWTELALELALLESLALHALGQTEQALAPLGHALAWAEPGGYTRIFLDEGQPMTELLHQAKRGIAVDYVNKLLSAQPFPSSSVHRPSSSVHRPSSSPLETLTRRELEVLTRLADGLSNKEIAAQLVIAVATVKQHLKHIYGKLDVHSRTQAINRAQDLNLL